MTQTYRDETHDVEASSGMRRYREEIAAARRAQVKVASLRQIKDVCVAPDGLTEGENQACNMATD